MFSSWDIAVNTNGMPQKVATAFAKLNEMVGAEYEPIAYLGSQVVNGTNHAVLAEQILITGRDTKNIVLIIFNEKPGEMELTLVAIERVMNGGTPLGGTIVDYQTEIPAEAKEAWAEAFEGFVGANVVPFVYLGTQVTKGVNYIFAATVTSVTETPKTGVAIVIVNAYERDVKFVNLLTDHQMATLGYAFTWLKD